MMIEPERLSAWSYARQRLGQAQPDVLTTLRDVAGVYSAHPTAPLALAARVRGLTRSAFGELEERRQAVRVVGMRGSAFLVPLDLADDVVGATRQEPGRLPGLLRSRGLDEATYASLKPRILEATRDPISPAALRGALGAAPDDERPYFAMRLMSREGLVLRVGTGRVRTDDLRWVATEAWLGRPLGEVDREVALARLAQAYLRGYGPARVQDFAWWAGIPGGRARTAIGSIATVEVTDGLLLPADLEAAWHATVPLGADAIDVLPRWDPYTMGLAPDGRSRLVDDAHRSLAYSTADTRIGATAGDGLPLVLRGGRAVATWGHRLSGALMAVTIAPFEVSRRRARELLARAEPAFDPIGELFEARVELTLAPR
jgi:hypothetical protein